MKKKLIVVILSIILIAAAAAGSRVSHAIGAGASIDHPGTVDEGGQYSVGFSVTSDAAMTANLNISVSGGGQLVGVSAAPGSVNGGAVVVAGLDGVTAITGAITFNVIGPDPVVISIGGDVTSIDDFSSAGVSASQSIPVHTKAQMASESEAASIAASIAEASSLEEEARRQSSIAEESRKQAEEAARQASIAASQAAEESRAQASRDEETRAEAERQASIDASIAAEQSSIAASRAAEESSRNASIAESVSIEESLRLESLSIQESIEESEAEESRALAESEAEESRSIAEESRSIAESIRESESLDDLTRAFEVGQDYFVPWDFEAESGRFLFAVEDTAIEAPEGFEKTDLLINRQYVFAAQNEKTAARTYLVFGSYDKDTEPEFYYFDMDTGRLFPYDSLNSMTDNRPQRIESTEESSEETDSEEGSVSGPEAEKHGFSILPAILFAAAGAIIGAGILGLILLIVRLARNKKESPAEGVPEPALSDADLPREPETVEMEEIPLEDNLVSDPDETMKVLFGETEPETLPLTEEEADSELPILEQESSDLHGVQAQETVPEAAESAPAESAFDKAFAGAAAAAATKASPSGENDSSFEIDEEEILTEDPVLSEELILPEDPEFSEDGNPADEADSLESEDLAAESPEDVDVEDEIIGEEE